MKPDDVHTGVCQNLNWVKYTQFCSLVWGPTTLWKLLGSPKEAVTFGLVEFSCAAVTKSLKEAVVVF